MTGTSRYPLESVAKIPDSFWPFVQQLPADKDTRFRTEGSLRYLPRAPRRMSPEGEAQQ